MQHPCNKVWEDTLPELVPLVDHGGAKPGDLYISRRADRCSVWTGRVWQEIVTNNIFDRGEDFVVTLVVPK